MRVILLLQENVGPVNK